MTKFFSDLFLTENGIYTLWGSKPVTLVVVSYATEEEKEAYYRTLSAEELKNCQILEKYDFPQNWEKWEKISARYPLKQYLLFRYDPVQDPSESPKVSYVYFINILHTAVLIEENYEAFRKVIGFDFHPLEMVLQMPQKDSPFWAKVNHNSYLLGLLFGYGKLNALAFQWKHYHHSPISQEYLSGLTHGSSDRFLTGKISVTLDSLQIPMFATFHDPDEVVAKYQKERDQIRRIYQGKDFVDVTLEKLVR